MTSSLAASVYRYMSIYPVSLPFPCSKNKLFIARLPSSRCASRGCNIFFCQVYLPGHPFGELVSREFPHLQPVMNSTWEDSQTGCSAFDRVTAIFPLGRIVLFSVDLDRRNVPFCAQQPHHSTSKGTVEPGRPIAFCVENRCNLGIDETSRIEFTNALLERFHIGRRFVAAHAAFVAELLMGSGLPVDLHPDLSLGSLAIDDHVPDHQAQHLLALGIGRRLRLPENSEITAQGQDGLTVRISDSSAAMVAPGLVLFLNGFHRSQFLFPLSFQRASYQAIFWLNRLILALSPLGLIARSLQTQFPLLALSPLFLF